MHLTDEIRIEASVSVVFAALNNPEILRACIPGCEELKKYSETELAAKVLLRIGPVKARFGGTVTLDTTGAPHRVSLTGSGNGGIAGFAKGGADVELSSDGEATVLKYEAKAEIGGKIAQLGGRLVYNTAQKLSRQFFANFKVSAENGTDAIENLLY